MFKPLSALFLLLATQAAFAAPITVKQSEVVNKIREVSLEAVRLKSGNATILSDSRGISVYTFDADTAGNSNCNAGCLKEWPVVTVAADEALPAPFGQIRSNDGKTQLTLNGMPLYHYDDDKKPGDVFGDYPSWHPVIIVTQ